jgi:hypothetical protein
MVQTQGSTRTQPPNEAHYVESSARENLIEHVFLGELLRGLWRMNVRDLEVLRPEVDSGGYDLARSAACPTKIFQDRRCVSPAALGGTTSLHREATMDLRSGVTELCSGENVKKSTFARFSEQFDFRLLQQYPGAKRT